MEHLSPDSKSSVALTSMQTALLYESNGSERLRVNLEQMLLRFDAGFASQDKITAAWDAVVQRHDVLRTVIHWRSATTPVQRVLPSVAVTVAHQNWDDLSDAVIDDALDHILDQDRDRGFDLQSAPGWRLSSFTFGSGAGAILLSAHHALLDGRSMARILAEFLHHLETGRLPNHSGAATFCDVVAQITAETKSETSEAEAFFTSYLAEFENCGALTLQSDAGSDAEPVHRVHSQTATLSAQTTDDLRAVARQCNATLANLVQAAWGLVLARWEGRDNICIGSVRSGRFAVANSQDTVGCLINTLPLRMSFSLDKTLGTLAQALRTDTCRMHSFEQTSANDIRRAARLAGHETLFDTAVMFERGSLQSLVFDQYRGALRPTITLLEEGGLPLALAAYDGDALRLVLESDEGHVAPETAAHLYRHLCQILRSMAKASAKTRLSQLDMFQEDERAALYALSRPEQKIPDAPRDVMARFTQRVAAQPDAPAITDLSDNRNGSLSYQQLDHKANGLAQSLQDHGVRAGDTVAIALARSPDFVWAMLAVLKLNAAFVPVDPSYPKAHQDHMITDSQARVVIANPGYAVPNGTVLRVDPVAPMRAACPVAAPQNLNTTCAYVIYTSGSTGVPKGVAISRQSFAAHAEALVPALELTSQDRVLQFASLSFDVALEEVFPTLLSGAHLILRDDAMAQSPIAFQKTLVDQKITVANVPTAFWAVITDYLARCLDKGQGGLVSPTLRLMIVGGEQVRPNVLQKWLKVAPNVRWLNGYGPTEATITSTLFEVKAGNWDGDVPIGRATAHARVFVLAPDGSLAPMGAPGQLVLGGQAVAMGYVDRPEQTDEVFRSDLLVDEDATALRVYLSGDNARWGTDGQLRFLGRTDRQVKLRGFRIDLRHVERVLERLLPGDEVLVGVLNRNTPAARLVAWIKSAREFDADAVKHAVQEALPKHMQPDLVQIAAFPTTAGGKVDLKALPHPSAEVVEKSTFEEPRTEGERQVQTAMAAVLGCERLSVTDDFYDLGGHSLIAVELLGRIERDTGIQLGVVDLKQNPTCRGLARILETGSSAPKHIIPIQPKGNRPPLFGIHILGAREGYFEPLAEYLGDDQPIMGVSVGSLDENTPTGIEFTARRYCADLMEYYPEGPINLMAVSLGAYMAFEMAHQLRAAGREVGLLALFDATGPGGRDEYQGIRRVWAHMQRVRYLGWAYPAQVIRNRIHNIRNHFARKQIQDADANGTGGAPMTVFEFIASNELAVQAYTPKPLDVPITIFRAESHFFDTPASKASGLGWEPVARAGVTVLDAPGGHLSMLENPNAATLAVHFSEILEAQQRDQLERTRRHLFQGSQRVAKGRKAST
ncbi:non-ribosomal peptide synthetase [Tritonibacter litoralis]|nr:amino acid adenylation domain-containing protein [Tritonibacter litoralis]